MGQTHDDRTRAAPELALIALPGIPMVEPGDDLAALISHALQSCGHALRSGDVLVVAQKIVSKSEDRYVTLSDVTPSTRAQELATVCRKDPRFVEMVLRESSEVLRCVPHVLITRHRRGHICANAGVDQSNIRNDARMPRVLLLPVDADASAQRLRVALSERWRADIAVIINDSVGRPWRVGVTGIAIGCAGMQPLVSRIGTPDLFGQALQITEIAAADELATAASIMQGQAAEARPVVLVRGVNWQTAETGIAPLIRSRDKDLFT